jgi:IstB-like ATP binding protein
MKTRGETAALSLVSPQEVLDSSPAPAANPLERVLQHLGSVYPPEAKSLAEATGLAGCAGVKLHRHEALCLECKGPGDEAGGAVCRGPLRGTFPGPASRPGPASCPEEHRPPGADPLIHGHTVLFTSTGQLLGDLCALGSDSALRRRLRHYARPQLLVIDAVGYLSYSNRHADLMFELIS